MATVKREEGSSSSEAPSLSLLFLLVSSKCSCVFSSKVSFVESISLSSLMVISLITSLNKFLTCSSEALSISSSPRGLIQSFLLLLILSTRSCTTPSSESTLPILLKTYSSASSFLILLAWHASLPFERCCPHT